MTNTKETLRPDEAAKLLGVSKRSIYRMIRNKKLDVVPDIHGHWRIVVASIPEGRRVA